MSYLSQLFALLLNAGTPAINDTIEKLIDDLYELRLESLLSVDDLVSEVIDTLEASLLWLALS